MGTIEKTKDVILQLKKVKAERNLTLQQVHEKVLENGGFISLSTVRRVFAEGSEDQGFRYEDSIMPIVNALLDVQSSSKDAENDGADIETLRAVLRYKNSVIAELQADAANVEAKVKAAKEEQQKKIDFLVAQLAGKDEQLKAKDQQIQDRGKLLDERRDFIYRKDRIIGILGLLLGICLVLMFSALIIDKLNPNLGFFWLDGITAFINDHLHSFDSVRFTGVQL